MQIREASEKWNISKLEKVTNMIQNMSSDDLNNLVRMLSNNSQKK